MDKNIFLSLTAPAVQQFILTHEKEDAEKLLLKYKTICGIPASLVINQIIGRKKAKTKFPTLYNSSAIIYPPSQNLEQSSSEITAAFKAEIFSNGERFADLTGGFGIDTFFFSKVFKETHYAEPNQELLEIARQNHYQLGCRNICYHSVSAEHFLESNSGYFDLIYLDPSRRATGNRKIFRLSDSVPNVSSLLPLIFGISDNALIKVSPLLDIHEGIRDLAFVERVYIVSVQNECKEVLFLCRKNFEGEPTIEAIDFRQNQTERFQFLFSTEKKHEIEFSEPLTYLYEPNASILKAGAFKSIGLQSNLFKIHPNTHFYTSKVLVDGFPGRVFKLTATLKSDIESTKQYFPDRKANVITRNYPLSPEQLKKKMKLQDGGELYVLGFSSIKRKCLFLAERMK